MATRKILLTVNKDGTLLVTEPSKKVTALNVAYKSAPLASEPEVIYNKNLINVGDAIRSANLVASSVAVFPDVLARNLNPEDGIYSLTDTFASNTVNSQQRVLTIKSNSNTTDLFVQTIISGVLNWYRIYSRYTGTALREYVTKFQNNCMIFLPEVGITGDLWSITGLTGAGDTPPVFPDPNKPCIIYFTSYNNYFLKIVTGAPTGVQGIASFGNYMLLWFGNRLYWSSPTQYWEFTPSPGLAGSVAISDGQGVIVTVLTVPNGILVFFTDNCVYGVYTGDPNLPFSFSRVIGGGGLPLSDQYALSPSIGTLTAARTLKGYQMISEDVVQTLPENIDNALNRNSLKVKEPNSAVIRNDVYNQSINGQVLFMYRDWMFVASGPYIQSTSGGTDRLPGRLHIVNIKTGATSFLEADIVGACYSQRDYVTDSIDSSIVLMLRKYNSPTVRPNYRFVTLDMSRDDLLPHGQGLPADDPTLLTSSVLLIGDISVSTDVTTVITAIRLIGTTFYGSGGGRATVRVYSVDINGPNSPVEFVYFAATDTYYGIIEGKKLQIEVEGFYLYLQSIEVEIATGGYL